MDSPNYVSARASVLHRGNTWVRKRLYGPLPVLNLLDVEIWPLQPEQFASSYPHSSYPYYAFILHHVKSFFLKLREQKGEMEEDCDVRCSCPNGCAEGGLFVSALDLTDHLAFECPKQKFQCNCGQGSSVKVSFDHMTEFERWAVEYLRENPRFEVQTEFFTHWLGAQKIDGHLSAFTRNKIGLKSPRISECSSSSETGCEDARERCNEIFCRDKEEQHYYLCESFSHSKSLYMELAFGKDSGLLELWHPDIEEVVTSKIVCSIDEWNANPSGEKFIAVKTNRIEDAKSLFGAKQLAKSFRFYYGEIQGVVAVRKELLVDLGIIRD